MQRCCTADRGRSIAAGRSGDAGTKTIEDVAAFLKLDKTQTMKALLFVTYDMEGNENGYVAAFVRGDRELNMTKLVNALDIPEHAIEFADETKCLLQRDA